MEIITKYLKYSEEELKKLSSIEITSALDGGTDNERYDLILKLKNIKYLKHIEDSELRMQCFFKINMISPLKVYENDLFNQIMDIKQDGLKISYIDAVENPYYKAKIVCSLKDNNLKLKLLPNFYSIYATNILETITDDNLLKEYYKICPKLLKLPVALNFKADNLKVNVLADFFPEQQIKIIISLQSDLLKEKYCSLLKYNDYQAEIVSSISDKEFILKYFKNNQDIKFRLSLIEKITDEELKSQLISFLDNSLYKEIFFSNIKENKDILLEQINIHDINYNIDKDITIGIELEACNHNAREIKILQKIFNDWNIKSDTTVRGGLEISSPILHFDESSLKELFFICNFMKQNDFYTNSSCGGHIHLGFDYIKNAKEFRMFLNLYGNVEDVLYIISNKAGTKARQKVSYYAKPFNEVLKNVSELHVNEEKINSLNNLVSLIRSNQYGKYYGLNTLNIGNLYNTLEFRIPNGEIDFNEIIVNIRLFAKILEKSKMLANTDEAYNNLLILYQQLIKNNLNQKERLEILLRILFDNEAERQIYHNRYQKNKRRVRSVNMDKKISLPIEI